MEAPTPRPKRAALNRLLALPLRERIKAVHADLKAKRRRFGTIPAFDLAEALGVPSADQPDSDWSFFQVTSRQTMEEYARDGGDIGEALSELAMRSGKRRRRVLEAHLEALENSDDPDFSFLRPSERKQLEEATFEDDTESDAQNGLGGIALYTVKLGKISLTFEASIEDDGTCIRLKTPYDVHDEKPDPRERMTDSW